MGTSFPSLNFFWNFKFVFLADQTWPLRPQPTSGSLGQASLARAGPWSLPALVIRWPSFKSNPSQTVFPSQVVLYDVDAGQVDQFFPTVSKFFSTDSKFFSTVSKFFFTDSDTVSKLWKLLSFLFQRLREPWATSRRSLLSLRMQELWGEHWFALIVFFNFNIVLTLMAEHF